MLRPTMVTMLLPRFLAAALALQLAGGCSTAGECSLNGRCTAGICVCYAPWSTKPGDKVGCGR
jgi:hypothetical protein